MSHHEHHETAEARELRERYNARAAESKEAEPSSSATANDSCWIELPLIPGSTWIELQHVSVEDLAKPAEEVVETPRGRLDFLLSFEGILSAGLHRSIVNITNFLYGREAGDERRGSTKRRRKESVESDVVTGAPVVSALDASIMMSRSNRSSFNSLNDSLPPLTAEEAKAKATRAAQQAEYSWLKNSGKNKVLSTPLEA